MPAKRAENIVFIVHYFPPINSTGGKRVEALSKYFARAGRAVTVVTTAKTGMDGAFTETAPRGVTVLEMDRLGRLTPSTPPVREPDTQHSPRMGLGRRLKTAVQEWFGQLPDPRLPFALAFGSPLLARRIAEALMNADVVISSMPPWPTHLAALLVHRRFKRRVVMDYRDNFSDNHIMPGSPAAKFVEQKVDRWLASRATGVVVISEPMAEYYRQFNRRVKVVLNGYDGEIIEEVRSSLASTPNSDGPAITVRYLGRISRDRIPRNLLAALAETLRAGALSSDDIRFEMYGDAEQLRSYLAERHPPLIPLFRFCPSVPYRAALALMMTADYLLFAETSDQSSLSARGVLTTKLFEYIACGRPILAEIGEDTEAGRLIRRAGPGHVVAQSQEGFERFLAGSLKKSAGAESDPTFARTLSRESQAEDYLGFLDQEVCAQASA
ncbi:MAG: glycosyltransferase [Thermoanaerobaculia bacterium]